jgi:hypothetical protein
MEISSQLHGPAALLPGKKPSVPIGWEARWPQSRSGRCGEDKNLENRNLALQPVAYRYTD